MDDGGVLDALLASGLPEQATLAKAADTKLPEANRQLLLLLKDKDPNILASMGLAKEVTRPSPLPRMPVCHPPFPLQFGIVLGTTETWHSALFSTNV